LLTCISVVFTASPGPPLPQGVAEVWQRFTRRFFSRLWENPTQRKRWALRWRTEAAVRDLAQDLGWEIAASLDSLVPIDALATTVSHAVLDELATGQQLDRNLDRSRHPDQYRHLSVARRGRTNIGTETHD
jgi:hypothetical protein